MRIPKNSLLSAINWLSARLAKNDITVMVNHARGQFISKILDVLPDNNLFVFNLGGLWLFIERDMSDVMSPGDILENVEIDLDEYGFFCVDMQLVGQADSMVVDSKGEVKVMKL